MSDSVRILLVDDHTIVRQGLARLLEEQPNFKVVGEATNGQVAVEKVNALKPDVVVMDIAMPRMNGIEAAKEFSNNCRIRKFSSSPCILMNITFMNFSKQVFPGIS